MLFTTAQKRHFVRAFTALVAYVVTFAGASLVARIAYRIANRPEC
jgi:hypothetical protein